MGNFKKDLAFGQAGESLLRLALLNEFDVLSSAITDHSGDFKYQVMVEVKTDRMWRKTGNVAVEILRDGEPSGISTTLSDIVVYILDGTTTFWYVGINELKDALRRGKYKRANGGDGDRTTVLLVPLDDFFKIFTKL